MKKAFALILCVALLLALPVGCKKKNSDPQPGELSNTQVSSDLIAHNHKYSFTHLGPVNSMANLKITEKKESGDTISLKATATAVTPSAKIALAADMKYVAKHGQWTLDTIKITKAVPTPTAAPFTNTVRMEINNYIANNQTSQDQNKSIALAIKDEEYHSLEVDIHKLIHEMKYEAGTETAKLYVSYKTDTLTFSGYYSLTFDAKKGWIIESEKQDNGQHYLLLHLDTLEQKASATDEK